MMDLLILSNHCITYIDSIWSWCSSLLLCFLILCAIFCMIFMNESGLEFSLMHNGYEVLHFNVKILYVKEVFKNNFML